jgi:predicted RNA-binding Zn-ribbon protein involved in translation (DUF1610 family)
MDHVLAAYLALQIEHVRLAEEVATLRQRAQEAEGVAQCMQEAREILTTAGLIPAGTAPIFLAEAVLAAVAQYRSEQAECLCTACNVIHPIQREGILQPCPDCGAAMAPTSVNLREIARLRTQLAESRDYAISEASKLRKEAERYRLLRDGDSWPAVFVSCDAPEPIRGAGLDAAIDAARKGGA